MSEDPVFEKYPIEYPETSDFKKNATNMKYNI
jgi:hypothetical protein